MSCCTKYNEKQKLIIKNVLFQGFKMKFIINKEWIRHVEDQNNKSLMKAGVFIENKLMQAMPSDTGSLKRSITINKINKNTIQVGSNTIQAYIMEKWREPWKMPNLDSLTGWTIRKFWLLGNKTQWYDKLPSKTKSVVFLVARKIATKWITARHLFTKTRNIFWQKAEQIYLYNMKQWIT